MPSASRRMAMCSTKSFVAVSGRRAVTVRLRLGFC
jgi:hypothetical protein